jgi:hypothetical protein
VYVLDGVLDAHNGRACGSHECMRWWNKPKIIPERMFTTKTRSRGHMTRVKRIRLAAELSRPICPLTPRLILKEAAA